MRRGVLLSVLLTLVALGGMLAPATAEVDAGTAGVERVIVTLRTPHANETRLGLRARAAQRATIASRTDAVDGIVRVFGGRVVHRFHSVPFVAVEATLATIARIRRAPDVAAVVPDMPIPAADAESTPLVGATATQAGGVDGSGQAIAILDTGVDKTHPFLAGKVVDEACFAATMTCPNGQAVQLGAGAAAPCTFAPADCRHGTHVAGIAAGGPAPGVSFTGVAPGAKLVAVQVFSRFVDPVCSTLHEVSPCALTLNSDMLAGLEHVYDVAEQFHVASVNMSIGGPVHTSPCDTNVLKPAIDNLRSINVATVIAAGNDGRSDGIAEPACISTAVRVGATTKADVVASYSNSASFLRLMAPGSAIRSSVPGGGYADFSGTSMATPHVAGAFALARQAYPTETVAQSYLRLAVGGVPVTDARERSDLPAPRRSAGARCRLRRAGCSACTGREHAERPGVPEPRVDLAGDGELPDAQLLRLRRRRLRGWRWHRDVRAGHHQGEGDDHDPAGQPGRGRRAAARRVRRADERVDRRLPRAGRRQHPRRRLTHPR